DQVLREPRSGARPLGNSDPGPEPLSGTVVRSASSNRPQPTSRSRQGQAPARPTGGATSRSRQSSGPGIVAPARRGARKARTQYRAHATTQYEKVIVAEFIIVVLVVAIAPF